MPPVQSNNSSKPSERPPAVTEQARRIRVWMEDHPYASFIDPRRLAGELAAGNKLNVAAGLALLVSKGELRPVVHVLDPNHRVFAIDGPFKLDEQLPDKVRDQRHQSFSVAEGERVTVYVRGDAMEVRG